MEEEAVTISKIVNDAKKGIIDNDAMTIHYIFDLKEKKLYKEWRLANFIRNTNDKFGPLLVKKQDERIKKQLRIQKQAELDDFKLNLAAEMDRKVFHNITIGDRIITIAVGHGYCDSVVYGACVFKKDRPADIWSKSGTRSTAVARLLKCPIIVPDLSPVLPNLPTSAEFKKLSASVKKEWSEKERNYRIRLMKNLQRCIFTRGVDSHSEIRIQKRKAEVLESNHEFVNITIPSC